MATFTPQRVSPRSIGLWLREGAELCQRQPLYFLAVTAGWAGVWYLPLPFTFLLLLGLPLPLAAGCVVAHAADTSRSPVHGLAAVPLNVWRNLLIAGALPWLVVGAMIVALAVLTLPVTLALGGDTNIFETLPLGAPQGWQAFHDLFAVTFIWLCTVGMVGWFIVPLMAVAGLSIVQAYVQAVRSIALNWFVVGVVFFIGWVCVPLLSFLSPLFVAPLLAILSSMMYVSFRHIWLGKGRNEAAQTADEDLPAGMTAIPVASR